MTDRNDPTGVRAHFARLRRVTGADLIGVLALTAVTDLFVLAPVLRDTPGRVLLGFAFLLFAPGYAVVTALFPESTDRSGTDDGGPRLATTERLALALVVSALLVPLLGIGLTVAGVGLQLLPLLVSLNAVTLGATAYASIRRVRLRTDAHSEPLEHATVPAASLDSLVPDLRNSTALDVALAVVIVLALAGVGFTAVAPSSEGHTELYLLTENESGDLVARDYPQSVTAGERVDLTLGIQNHEGRVTDYTVVVELQRVAIANGTTNGTADGAATVGTSRAAPAEVRVLERTDVERYSPTLEPNATWHRQHSVSPRFAGERVRLVYLLYRGDAPSDPTVDSAYREVHLWLDVSESDASSDR